MVDVREILFSRSVGESVWGAFLFLRRQGLNTICRGESVSRKRTGRKSRKSWHRKQRSNICCGEGDERLLAWGGRVSERGCCGGDCG